MSGGSQLAWRSARWAKIGMLAVLAAMLIVWTLSGLRQPLVPPQVSWLATGVLLVLMEWSRHRDRRAAERGVARIHERAAALSCEAGEAEAVIHRPGPDGFDVAWTVTMAAFFASPLVLPMRFSPPWAVPVVVGLLLVAHLFRQAVRRSLLVVMGPHGVEFTHLRLTLPWSAFGHPRALVSDENGLAVRWELVDPESAMAGSRLGPLRRRWALRRIRKAEGAIEIPATWMREAPDVVLAASWRLAREANP